MFTSSHLHIHHVSLKHNCYILSSHLFVHMSYVCLLSLSGHPSSSFPRGHGDGAAHVDINPLGDQEANVHHPLGTLVLQQYEGCEVGHGEQAQGGAGQGVE